VKFFFFFGSRGEGGERGGGGMRMVTSTRTVAMVSLYHFATALAGGPENCTKPI
jgi:hypothetical protein